MDEDRLFQEMMAQTNDHKSPLVTVREVDIEAEWDNTGTLSEMAIISLQGIFNALASRQRLEILAALMNNAKTPGGLALMLELPKSTVSRHLRALEQAGLTALVQTGRRREITMAPGLDALLEAAQQITR